MSGLDCEQLTLFPADSRASHLVLPGSEEARKMTVTSGRKCLELYHKSGPLGSLARMLLGSSTWRSTRCYLTWKPSATPARRLLFRLVPSTHRTGGTDVPLLPTMTAQDYKHRGPNSRQQGLPEYVRMWPTPRANDAEKRGHIANDPRNGLPAAALYATPLARDYRTGSKKRYGDPKRTRNLNDQIGGQLNPTWVEWLMGFPLGWTDLNASETP